MLIVGREHPWTGHTGLLKERAYGGMLKVGLEWVVKLDNGVEVGASLGQIRKVK